MIVDWCIALLCRMLESSYNVLFGKLALRCLFEDYFHQARHFTTRIMLKPIDDPHVDLIATVSINQDKKEKKLTYVTCSAFGLFFCFHF